MYKYVFVPRFMVFFVKTKFMFFFYFWSWKIRNFENIYQNYIIYSRRRKRKLSELAQTIMDMEQQIVNSIYSVILNVFSLSAFTNICDGNIHINGYVKSDEFGYPKNWVFGLGCPTRKPGFWELISQVYPKIEFLLFISYLIIFQNPKTNFGYILISPEIRVKQKTRVFGFGYPTIH